MLPAIGFSAAFLLYFAVYVFNVSIGITEYPVP